MDGHVGHGTEASGWFVFATKGLLHTSHGQGSWSLAEDEMEVEIKGLRLRLQYYGTWEGKKRPNFRSLAVFWLF